MPYVQGSKRIQWGHFYMKTAWVVNLSWMITRTLSDNWVLTGKRSWKKWPLLGSLRDTIPHCDQIIIQTKSSGGKQVQVTTDNFVIILTMIWQRFEKKKKTYIKSFNGSIWYFVARTTCFARPDSSFGSWWSLVRGLRRWLRWTIPGTLKRKHLSKNRGVSPSQE